MTTKQIRQQSEIVNNWIDECATVFKMKPEDVENSHIVAFLAQKELGLHKEILLVNRLLKNIAVLEQFPNDMKLEDLDFKTQYVWDTDLQRLGLSSRLFTNGSEFGDTIYRLQKPNDKIRWCVFSVDRNYYISKEEDEPNNGWCEIWTKQMDKDLEEAKKYCEEDAFKSFIDVEIHFCNKCKYRLDFKEAPCLVCESKSINSI